MTTQLSSWYAFNDERATILRCAACHSVIDIEVPGLDHHARACPRCGVACAFLYWYGRILQVVPSYAPAVIRRALRFAQEDFDELEFAELIVALEELMDAVYATIQTDRGTGS
jgi:hypothetical protein